MVLALFLMQKSLVQFHANDIKDVDGTPGDTVMRNGF